jgi:hypothetical protein
MCNLLLSIVVIVGLTLSTSSNAYAAGQSERETVLKACVAEFGPPIDPENGLFEVNRYYLLEVKFDDRGHVTQLGVLPKHWFADDHAEWDEPDDFGELTEVEYEVLLNRIEAIRRKGPVVERAKLSTVSNCTARIRDHYKSAVLETGEVVDARRSEEAPRTIKYFIVYFTAIPHRK